MTTPLQYGTFGIDSAVYPIDGYLVDPALKLIDPVIYYLLDYNAAMLKTYMGTAWTYYVNQMTVNNKSTIPNVIVQQAVPYNPIIYIANVNFKFPLFAMYRTSFKVSERVRGAHRKASKVEMLYILPPLSASQSEKLLPFLNGVVDVLADRNEVPQDPNYNSNQNVSALANFESKGLTEGEWAYIPTKEHTNLFMPTLRMEMTINERRMVPAGAFSPLTGFDIAIDNTTKC